MQSVQDQSVAHVYAQNLSEYGGMYHDGDVLVVLFTAKLAEHERALRSIVAGPELVRVLPAQRSWADVVAATDRVRDCLAIRPDVVSIGATVADDAFAVTVGLDPYSDLAADAVRAACAPERVLIRSAGTIVRLPMRAGSSRATI